MAALNNLYKKYFSENLPLRIRIFNIMFFCGFITGLISTITSAALNTSMSALGFSIGNTIFMFAMFYFAYLSGKYDLFIIIGVIGVNFVFFPCSFLTSGALKCGMPSYFILGIIFTLLIIRDKFLTSFLVTLELLFYSFIIYAVGRWPEFVISDAVHNKYSVIATDVIIVSLAIGLVVKILTSQYKKDRNNIEGLVHRLEELSVKDPLTGAFNRRYLMDFMVTNINRSFDYGLPISIIMFDIDKFKNLNDKYGHIVGDEVLKGVTYILKNSIRENDIVARYGGEEFIIVFPDTPTEVAYKRAEEIREKIQKSTFYEDLKGKVTISGGIGEYVKGMSPEALIEDADKKLYISKETGRNRITRTIEQTEIPPQTVTAVTKTAGAQTE